jgi:hypothetical protein
MFSATLNLSIPCPRSTSSLRIELLRSDSKLRTRVGVLVAQSEKRVSGAQQITSMRLYSRGPLGSSPAPEQEECDEPRIAQWIQRKPRICGMKQNPHP